MSNTPYPLGVYIGNIAYGNSSLNASFEARYQAFSTLMGAQPTFDNTYVDYTKPISQWASGASGAAYSMQQTPDAQNMMPVIALPMSSNASGSASADQQYKNFAAGNYDSVLQAMVKSWATDGFATQYWRVGWEMNLSSLAVNYAGTTAVQADWIAAFQHIYTVLHAAATADGVNLKVIWNPGITNYSNAGVATQTLYPGNQYVDVIAADIYGGLNPYSLYDWDKNDGTVDSNLQQWASDPVNLTHYYTYPAATQYSLDGSSNHSLSLANLLAFAKQQGKEVGIAETGAGSTADGANLSDNPTFVNWLSSTLASSGDHVDFVNMWDYNEDGNYEFTSQSDKKPLEAAAWANDFGAQGETATVKSSVLHFGGPTDPSSGSPEAGVVVTLLNASGGVVATTTSDGNGLFSFGSLAAGTYQLQYTPPANQAIDPGTLANTTTDLTAQFVVGVGQTVSAPAGSMISVSTVSGKVLLSGVGDFGVPVALLNASGTVVASATTNSAGAFSFGDLAAGSYQLQYTPVHGQSLSPDSQADPTTGLTPTFTLTYGQPLNLPAEVYLPPGNPATVQGSVVHIGAGTSGASGSGEAGVTVSLFDTSGALIGTTVSASDGSYSFTQLNAGTYEVGYTPPSGQAIEPGSAADATTGLTASFAVAAGQTVVAPTGSLVSFASISGQTLLTGVAEKGVTVSLLNGSGTVVATTTSNTAGNFAFTGLLGLNYQVKYSKPAGQLYEVGSEANAATGLSPAITLGYGQALVLPGEEFLTSASQATIQTSVQLYGTAGNNWLGGDPGVTVSLLNSSGTTIATAVSDKNGWLQFTSLGAGTYQLQYTPPAGQALEPATKTNPNPGLSAPVTVAAGQTVSTPQEALVSQAASVTGQTTLAGAGDPGVVVALLTAAGAAVSTTTTNAAGAFSFGGLAGGTYEVQYTAPQGQALTPGGAANAGTGLTPTFALKIGQSATLVTEALISSLSTVQSNVAHFGSSNDPVSGSPEAGVTVTLEDTSGHVIATTTSGSDGSFAFAQVAAGTYQLLYTPPAGQAIEPGSLVNPTTDLTASFTVAAGQTVSAPSGAMVSLADLNGQVLLAGAGEAGVAVAVLTAAGTTVASATTDATGSFTFSDLAAGSYQVQYAAPAGLALAIGSAADPTTGLTPAVTLTYGQTVSLPAETLTANTATVQSTVLHFGASTDPVSGSPDPGVTVTLEDTSGDVIATTTSGSDGSFAFAQVAAGTYELLYTPPAGQVIEPGSLVNPTTDLTAPFTVAAGQTVSAPGGAMVSPDGISGQVQLAGVGEAGVTVALLNAGGTTVATTTSNASGAFTFANVAAGSYQVDYTKPKGQLYETGSQANAAGLTASFTLAYGQSLTLPPEVLLTSGKQATVQGTVLLYSASNAYVGGDGGVTVTLLNTSGTVVASAVTAGNGWFQFINLGVGTYDLKYAAPAGQAIKSGSQVNPTTGLAPPFTVAAGQTYASPSAAMSQLASAKTLGSKAAGTTATSYAGETAAHGANGTVTIDAVGGGHLFDGGTGISFLNADGSGRNIFVLNAPGAQHLATITGFNPAANDLLFLQRTLAGTDILPDLSNVGSYITAAATGANTTLYEAPKPGGTPTKFAVLVGVHVTVAQLQAAHDLSLS